MCERATIPLDQMLLDGLGNCSAPCVDVKLGVDVSEVGVYRMMAQIQLVGHFLEDHSP